MQAGRYTVISFRKLCSQSLTKTKSTELHINLSRNMSRTSNELPSSSSKSPDDSKTAATMASHLKRKHITPKMITIDGSKGEGGGQVLRNSISFANILRVGVHVTNIRAGRSKPGLKAQHVKSLQVATMVCSSDTSHGDNTSTLTGDDINSCEITFTPCLDHKQQQQQQNCDVSVERTVKGEINTAGSICLLLQAALPCALWGTPNVTRLLLKGGTNATMAPQYDYWERVFLPTLRNCFQLPPHLIQPKVIQRGYFPKGGGEVHVRVEPLTARLPPIQRTERGDVCNVHIRAFHAGALGRHLAVEAASVARDILQRKLPDVVIESEIVTERKAVGSALGVLLVAKTTTGCLLGGSALSTPKQRADAVGTEAAEELLSTIKDGGCVDEWMQDQLILFMALAEGESEIVTGSLTLHTQTAIWIAEELAGAKFTVVRIGDDVSKLPLNTGEYGREGRISGKHRIICQGVGYLREKE